MPLRNIRINIENTTYQAAVSRASQEQKTIDQLIVDFLAQYAAEATISSPKTYTVQSGDTLGRIARKVYGDAHKYPLIIKANNITDPSRIWVGQVLIIPATNGVTATETARQPASRPTSPAPTPAAVTPAPVTPAPVTPAPPPPATPAPPAPSTPAPPLPSTPTTQPPTSGRTVSKPAVQWAPSPNFNQRRSLNDITAITLHATANSTLTGVISWFKNPKAQVSAHYTIGKDGQIAQHVQDRNRAWHAGRSIWKGRSSCNDYCLGIELVNLNDGADPYPEVQHQANVALCTYLCARYNISTDDIMAHYDIALPIGRKSDPRNYDMNRLRREVAARLGRR